MYPRAHIILGFIFTLLIWTFFPQAGLVNLLLVFLASFLIDFDHYMVAVYKTGRIRLSNALEYYEKQKTEHMKEHQKGINRKGDFHLFHTVEFHALIGVLGIFSTPFLYIFIGMVFHSLLDVADGLYKGWIYKREFFFFRWLRKQITLYQT